MDPDLTMNRTSNQPDTAAISDAFMQKTLANSHIYSLVILGKGPNYDDPDTGPVIWEHGRRNFALRADGRMAIVGPVLDDSAVCGISIVALDVTETAALMAEDPAVTAGILTVSVHPMKGFPGDHLPD